MAIAVASTQSPALDRAVLLYDAIANIRDRIIHRVGPPNQICWRALRCLVESGGFSSPLKPYQLANLLQEPVELIVGALELLQQEDLVEPGMYAADAYRPTVLGFALVPHH